MTVEPDENGTNNTLHRCLLSPKIWRSFTVLKFSLSKSPYLLKKSQFLEKGHFLENSAIAPQRVVPTIDILKISFFIYLNNNPVSPSTCHFHACRCKRSVEIRFRFVGWGGWWVFGFWESETMTEKPFKCTFPWSKRSYLFKKIQIPITNTQPQPNLNHDFSQIRR